MSSKKTGRNDPCTCGSGRKYKKCCLLEKKPPLPIRPRQHELDDLAVNFIQNHLPDAWTSELVSKDYGKDIRVEIFAEHPFVGHVAINQEFVIQSKGHERFKIVHEDKIAQQLEISTINYLYRGLLPCLLITYSEEEKKACYLWLKPYIEQVLDKQDSDWRNTAGDSEVTIHIPLNNVFDEYSLVDIQQYVSEYHNHLLKQSAGLPIPIHTPKINFPQTTPYQLRYPQITNCLPRPHLTEKMSQILPNSHVFLHSGAGYGKTWLIHDFITTYKYSNVIWFTFDEIIPSGIQFIKLLATELYKKTQTTGEITLSYLQQMGHAVDLGQVIEIFHDELQCIESITLLVLEDFHFVSDEEIELAISLLLSGTFENVQIVTSSRHPLPIKQAKLRAQGLLTVITQDEMAFSLQEIQSYFEQGWNISLSFSQLQMLYGRIEGWVAALALAANVLDEKTLDKVDELFDLLNGYDGNIYDFFAEEVFRELKEPEQYLLKRLALVYLIDPDIVNLFTDEKNGGAILRSLHSRSTFLLRNDNDSYKLHSLFSEFLEEKFRNDEGITSIESTHKILARHYYDKHDWYSVTEHASKGKEYDLATEGLIQIAPISIDLGFGYFFLKFTELVPEEYLEKSDSLQEMIGRSALQTGQLEKAMSALSKANALYEDPIDINRVEFLLAEIKLDVGKLSSQEFVAIARTVASNCYAQNEYILGFQAQLKAIETAQTLTVHAVDKNNILQDLIQEVNALIEKLEVLGEEYDLVKSKAFTTKAHLFLQKITTKLSEESGKYRLREELGHPISLEEKVKAVQGIATDLEIFIQFHEEAENLIGDQNEIQLAFTRLRFIDDSVFLDNMIKISFMVSGSNSILDDQFVQMIQTKEKMHNWFLPWLEECRRIFSLNHILDGLANVYFVAAEIYDSLEEFEDRNKMAGKALEIATGSGFTELAKKIEKLLQGQHTFSWVMEQANRLDDQDDYQNSKEIANWNDEYKRQYVDLYLSRLLGNDIDEQRRKIVEVSVDEMVIVAQQKIEWCQFLGLVEDLEHVKSLETIHQEIPNKYIICTKLNLRSPGSGKHFQDLWPLFRVIYCLGCVSKSPFDSKMAGEE